MRIVYSFMNILEDLAGIAELVKSFIGILIFKISKTSFYMSAMKKLFLVKYKNNAVFDQRSTSKGKSYEHVFK